MNLPNRVVRHVPSTIALIFRSMAYVPERFPNNCDDRRLAEGQLLRSASVKRKPCGAAAAVLQNNAAMMSVVGYFIPVCSYHFVVAVWSAKQP